MRSAILKCLASTTHEHKMNLIGRAGAREGGPIERQLGVRFTDEERFQADRAFESLKAAGFLQPTYSDMTSPEEWVRLTARGKEALTRRVVDDLDEVLDGLDSELAEMRYGAWATLASEAPDSVRQAAHSARELVERAIRASAPDETVRAQPWYVASKESRTGITRRQRLKFIAQARSQGEASVKVAERAGDLLLAVLDRLQAASHGPQPTRSEAEEDLRLVETLLRRILLP